MVNPHLSTYFRKNSLTANDSGWKKQWNKKRQNAEFYLQFLYELPKQTIFASKKVDWALSFSSISPPATDSYPEYKELKVLPEFKKKIKEKKTVLETIH